MISESGLEWHSQDQSFVQMIKRSVVEQVVIDSMIALAYWSVSTRQMKATVTVKQLNTIQLTAIGKAILTLMNSSSTANASDQLDM